MIRTQIYLPEDLHQALKEKAREQNLSLAEVIRRSVEKKIKPKRDKKPRLKGADVLLKIAEMGRKLNVKAPRDLSVNLDRYLYGDKSPKWGYLYKKKVIK